MYAQPRFSIRSFVSSLALAAAVAIFAPVHAKADTAKPANISCLTYLSQFQGAVPYYVGSPQLPAAQDLAAKGRKLCLAGDEAAASAYLTQALREIGVSPQGITTPPSGQPTVQEAERPLTSMPGHSLH